MRSLLLLMRPLLLAVVASSLGSLVYLSCTRRSHSLFAPRPTTAAALVLIVTFLVTLFATPVSNRALAGSVFDHSLRSPQEQVNKKQPAPSLPADKFVNTPSQARGMPLLSVNLGDSENPDDLVPALRVVAILTILTIAPAILLLMSAFTRILIVLSFLRQALGAPTMPPNQVLIGLSLFLTYFVMAPTTNIIYDQAIKPYMEKQITSQDALEKASAPVKKFMLAQTRKEDLQLFFQLSGDPQPQKSDDVGLRILIPSFVISELRAAFQIGFLVFLPFVVIDMLVSGVLMAMGMMMLPPTVVSLPLKIVLFVLVDGWSLLAGSLVKSFSL